MILDGHDATARSTEPDQPDLTGVSPTKPTAGTVIVPTSGRRCSFVRPDGRACRATPGRDAPWCFLHNPDLQLQVAEARHLGGIRRRRDRTLKRVYDLGGLTTIPDLRRYLEVALTDALLLENSVARSRVLIAGVAAAAALIEQLELAERVAALEAALTKPLPNEGTEASA